MSKDAKLKYQVLTSVVELPSDVEQLVASRVGSGCGAKENYSGC